MLITPGNRRLRPVPKERVSCRHIQCIPPSGRRSRERSRTEENGYPDVIMRTRALLLPTPHPLIVPEERREPEHELQ